MLTRIAAVTFDGPHVLIVLLRPFFKAGLVMKEEEGGEVVGGRREGAGRGGLRGRTDRGIPVCSELNLMPKRNQIGGAFEHVGCWSHASSASDWAAVSQVATILVCNKTVLHCACLFLTCVQTKLLAFAGCGPVFLHPPSRPLFPAPFPLTRDSK